MHQGNALPAAPPLSPNGMNVRRFDRERFVTALFAPAASREDLFTLYAFNIELARIRETVKESLLGQIRLQWWRDNLPALLAGRKFGHPVGDDMAALCARGVLPAALIELLIEARNFDMEDRPPQDRAELDSYVGASAGVLCRLAGWVLTGAELGAADHVGRAWGMLGLLRAHSYHIKLRRLFVPTDWMAAEGLDPEELIAGQSPPALARWAEQCAEQCEAHLRSARAMRSDLPRAAQPALLPARLADFYLKALRRAGYDLVRRDWSEINSRPLSLLAASLTGRF